MMVDTLTIARELKAADLPSGQAEAIAAAIGRALASSDEAATDLAEFETDIGNRFLLLDQKLEAMEQRLTAKIETMRSSLLIWIIGVIMAGGGLIVTLSRLK